MARPPQLTTTTPTWNVFVISGTDISTVNAAVLTKTKSLATAYNQPVSGQTAGSVIYGTVTVDPVVTSVNSNNTVVFTIMVRWQTETVPA
jgi:hypothetical protein